MATAICLLSMFLQCSPRSRVLKGTQWVKLGDCRLHGVRFMKTIHESGTPAKVHNWYESPKIYDCPCMDGKLQMNGQILRKI